MTHGFQHWDVGHRVGIRIGSTEIDVLGSGHFDHGLSLGRAVGIELDGSGVAPVLSDLRPGGDHVVDAQIAAKWSDYLFRTGRDDHHFPPCPTMTVDEGESLGIGQRSDDLVHGVLDQ